MLKFSSDKDPQLASIPPPYHGVVMTAVQNICSILGPDSHPEDQGFVVFIEAKDLPDSVSKAIHKNISNCLEGVSRDGNCLVGVVLYGNSGSGAMIICPEVEGYASAISHILRNHLT